MDITYTFKAYKNLQPKGNEEIFKTDVCTKLIYSTHHTLNVNISEKQITLNEGEALLVPPFTSISFTDSENDNTFTLISFALIDSTSINPDMFFHEIFDSASDIAKAISKYLSLSHPLSLCDELLKKSIEYFIIYAANIAMDNNRISVPDKLTPVIAYIESNYWQNISVADLASVVNISESAMYKLFVSAISKSPKQYIKKRRMYHASMLLLNSDKSISDIAIETGFYDPFYFSKEFKKDFGLSPSEYRKTNKN